MRFFGALLAVFTLALGSAAMGGEKKFKSYLHGFQLSYPSEWKEARPDSANSRAKIMSPSGSPHAECAVIIKKYPQLTSLDQAEISRVFIQRPNRIEIRSTLMQGFDLVYVKSAATAAMGHLPAWSTRFNGALGVRGDKVYVVARALMTATPGKTWTMICGGQGDTYQEANEAYQYWNLEINKVMSSFRFR